MSARQTAIQMRQAAEITGDYMSPSVQTDYANVIL